jgi:hypothetical protein
MTAKEDALNALDTARKMLDAPEPMAGLRLSLLHSTLDFAASAIERIEETKRPRRAKAAPTTAPAA